MRLKRFDSQINVSLTSDLKSDMDEIAARIGLSMSEFARAAIQEKIRRHENKKERIEEMRE